MAKWPIARKREYDQKRAKDQPWRAWYKTKAWAELRIDTLTRDLYRCQRCGARLAGKHPAPNSPAVNHRKAHKGDWSLFIDPENVESVCKTCHDGVIQQEEDRGYSKALDASGWPTDARHPANRRG